MLVLYEVKRQGNDTEVVGNYNLVALENFMKAEAQRLNYGLYRVWSENNITYYDVGPVVYLVRTVVIDD